VAEVAERLVPCEHLPASVRKLPDDMVSEDSEVNANADAACDVRAGTPRQ
jgi:hypothetical protein